MIVQFSHKTYFITKKSHGNKKTLICILTKLTLFKSSTGSHFNVFLNQEKMANVKLALLVLIQIGVGLSCGEPIVAPDQTTEYRKECYSMPSNEFNFRCAKFWSFWYFDSETKTCRSLYGQCYSGDNVFVSKDACIEKCAPDSIIQPSTTVATSINFGKYPACEVEMDERDCLEHSSYGERTWYFDSVATSCKPCNFVGHNSFKNRFTDAATCNKLCGYMVDRPATLGMLLTINDTKMCRLTRNSQAQSTLFTCYKV